jgi:hypothetical protein
VSILIPSVNVFHSPPDVSKRISDTIAIWADGLATNRNAQDVFGRFEKIYEENEINNEFGVGQLGPIIGKWENYLTATYSIGAYYTEEEDHGLRSFHEYLVFFCFDISTGETVRLADKLPGSIDYAKANIWADGQGMEGYIPADGSVITETWVSGRHINMILTEPDGRELTVIFYNDID